MGTRGRRKSTESETLFVRYKSIHPAHGGRRSREEKKLCDRTHTTAFLDTQGRMRRSHKFGAPTAEDNGIVRNGEDFIHFGCQYVVGKCDGVTVTSTVGRGLLLVGSRAEPKTEF